MQIKIKIALAALLLVTAQGLCQSTPSPDELTVSVALPQQTVCMGSKSLTLELYVTNSSSKEVPVSRNWALGVIDYEVAYDLKDGFKRIDLMQRRGDPLPGSTPEYTWIKLPAGGTKRYEATLELGQPFFQQPAFYKAKVEYWGAIAQQKGAHQEVRIPSNWVLFEVKSCPSKAGESTDTVDPKTGNLRLTVPVLATTKPSH
jgi:hypothetical protein